jgi:hypothetical protein
MRPLGNKHYTQKSVLLFQDMFYNKDGSKKIPSEILNANVDAIKSFIDGFLVGDGHKDKSRHYCAACKSRSCAFGLHMLALKYRINTRFTLDKRRYGKRIECPVWCYSSFDEKYRQDYNNAHIVDVGERAVYDVTTASGKVCAGGFIVHNCDDYAARYRVGAQILNTRRVWKNVLKQMVGMVTQPLPVAVGEVWYKQNAGGGHAINCAFIGSRPDFVFIEPQTQKIVELSNSEIRSIFFVRF